MNVTAPGRDTEEVNGKDRVLRVGREEFFVIELLKAIQYWESQVECVRGDGG